MTADGGNMTESRSERNPLLLVRGKNLGFDCSATRLGDSSLVGLLFAVDTVLHFRARIWSFSESPVLPKLGDLMKLQEWPYMRATNVIF